jgi:hypothetical protein
MILIKLDFNSFQIRTYMVRITNWNLNKLGFIFLFWSKRVYKIGSRCWHGKKSNHWPQIFRCLAFGAAVGLNGYNLNFCTECYYKPGSCGPVHQGTPLPGSPPPPPHPLGLLRGETSPPLPLMPASQGPVRPAVTSSPAFQLGGVKGWTSWNISLRCYEKMFHLFLFNFMPTFFFSWPAQST